MQNIIMSAQNIIAGNLQLPHSQGVSESITNIDCVYPWRRFANILSFRGEKTKKKKMFIPVNRFFLYMKRVYRGHH